MSAACLLLTLLLGVTPGEPDADSLSAPPRADESPTALSCTVESLRRGSECVFESEPAPEPVQAARQQAASNVRTVQALGRVLCAEAARAGSGAAVDPVLAALCERRFGSAAEACGLEGAVAVVDGEGRFAARARGCYLGLSEVLQQAQALAATASTCCQCAARRGCLSAGERCYLEVSRQELEASALACLGERCSQSCPLLELPRPEQARTPPGH